MSTYSMSQVETLTGIKSHTLRIWERRYNFLVPLRTDTNIRYYTDAQLRKLLNIGILTRNGYRISAVDKMDEKEIHALVTDILSTHSEKNQDHIDGLTLSMLEMDENAFNRIFQRQLIRSGFLDTITKVIYPFLNMVGGLWITNKVIPAQEHFITNLIRQKIIAAIEYLPLPSENAPSILLFLIDGESHEIGLLLASFIARQLGWKVYYLGQNVPLDNIKSVIDIAQPKTMMTICTVSGFDKLEDLLKLTAKETDIPLLISGDPNKLKSLMLPKYVYYLPDPDAFIDFLTEAQANNAKFVKGPFSAN